MPGSGLDLRIVGQPRESATLVNCGSLRGSQCGVVNVPAIGAYGSARDYREGARVPEPQGQREALDLSEAGGWRSGVPSAVSAERGTH